MSNDESNKAWQDVFSGKKLPIPFDPDEQNANTVRQYLIWRQAKESTNIITSSQAKAYYEHIRQIRNQQSRRRIFYWSSSILIAVLILFIPLTYFNNKLNWEITTLNMLYNLYSPSQQTEKILLSTDLIKPSFKVGQQQLIPEMVYIPKGTYIMGCSAGWDDSTGGCRDNEYPAHKVTIDAFEASRFEITVAQFQYFVKKTGYKTTAEINNIGCTTKNITTGIWATKKSYHWKDKTLTYNSTLPITCISWQDTQYYLQWLNELTHMQYRLLTEEEWEYAARANKVTAFYWGSHGSHNFANYIGKEGEDNWEKSAPVGQFVSNAFGLHDTAGNVWEWVSSCWRENYTIQPTHCSGTNPKYTRRGGGWDNYAPSIRAAYRSEGHALDRSDVYGFRIAHDQVSISKEK